VQEETEEQEEEEKEEQEEEEKEEEEEEEEECLATTFNRKVRTEQHIRHNAIVSIAD